MPIRWAEPFGLVMVEALDCGTPVIAFPEGSAPEVGVPAVVRGYERVYADAAAGVASSVAAASAKPG